MEGTKNSESRRRSKRILEKENSTSTASEQTVNPPSKTKRSRSSKQKKNVIEENVAAPVTPKDEEKKEELQCGICLEEVVIRGLLNSCAHPFCFSCITEWSKTANTCPFCKARFTSLQEIDVNKPKTRAKTVTVNHRDQRIEPEDPESWFEFDEDDLDVAGLIRTGLMISAAFHAHLDRMAHHLSTQLMESDDEDFDSDEELDEDDEVDYDDSEMDDGFPNPIFFPPGWHNLFRIGMDSSDEDEDDEDEMDEEDEFLYHFQHSHPEEVIDLTAEDDGEESHPEPSISSQEEPEVQSSDRVARRGRTFASCSRQSTNDRTAYHRRS